ncbi:hypothetical protein ACNRBH_09190 [Ralstonia pseudosolanacearum]|uniref:hypothetical protein n=1 Tax=Ralstonia pseudosolanacearum TaxID=1310165 RepID=UPI00267731E1|nr:hypothetical protein [Ralstonia pseudosolanacearum]MDO3527535.1 hypothetical protein [Ralstonia pseudosolanacearum]MDO3531614.1 hypothetical protein [Ralstonia pseudosolanacearum]
MLELIHEEMRGGLRIRLTVLEHSMVAEAMRGNVVLAKSSSGHGGLLGPNSYRPQSSSLAKTLMEQVADKATGVRRKSNFDALIDDLRAAQRRGGGGLMKKALGMARRVVFFSKARRDVEPASLRAAGLLSRARQHAEATYQPNAPVNDAVLRRVLAAAQRGVLSADDVQAVQQAHGDGRALPSHVLNKLARG